MAPSFGFEKFVCKCCPPLVVTDPRQKLDYWSIQREARTSCEMAETDQKCDLIQSMVQARVPRDSPHAGEGARWVGKVGRDGNYYYTGSDTLRGRPGVYNCMFNG